MKASSFTPDSAARVTAARTDWVNASSTMIGLAHLPRLCHAPAMRKPDPMAGGFFLIAPIVVGFIWGIVEGRAMEGALVGAAIGVVLALAVWLVDRARQRR